MVFVVERFTAQRAINSQLLANSAPHWTVHTEHVRNAYPGHCPPHPPHPPPERGRGGSLTPLRRGWPRRAAVAACPLSFALHLCSIEETSGSCWVPAPDRRGGSTAVKLTTAFHSTFPFLPSVHPSLPTHHSSPPSYPTPPLSPPPLLSLSPLPPPLLPTSPPPLSLNPPLPPIKGTHTHSHYRAGRPSITFTT